RACRRTCPGIPPPASRLSLPGHELMSEDTAACHHGAMTGTWAEPPNTATALLLLGRGSDPSSERGVECPGELPAPSDPGLVERARAAKAALGDKLFVLGHHYQRDEVIQFADVTGDSFKLAQQAAARPEAEWI